MIDINLLRGEKSQETMDLLKLKEPGLSFDHFLELDKKLREEKGQLEKLQSEKNQLSKNPGKPSQEMIERSNQLSGQIKQQETLVQELSQKWNHFFLRLPNVPAKDLAHGNKEANEVVFSSGTPKSFDFKPKNHTELNESLKWFDFKAASKMSGSGFVLYKGDGLKMIYALTQLMLKNNSKRGFEPVMPPLIVKDEVFVLNGSLPKFGGDYYKLATDSKDEVQESLIPTAEVALTGMHSGQEYSKEQLPIRNCSWTSCFRKEAGTYGSTERGLIRIHQFEKVELYSVCAQEQSEAELEYMVKTAQTLLDELGLTYRISKLAMQDCSFVSHKTYDIEVWMPGQGAYYEVSSCSNCTDFQSRRARIKYTDGNSSKLAHTLNASSLALPRLMVAIIETYQNADGTISLPKILKDQMNNLW